MRPNGTSRKVVPCLLVALAALTALAAAAMVEVPATVRAAVDAPDRSAADRALDAGRHPVDMLAFFDVRPGMHVAELGAGMGYTTELLARAVGPKGVVYAQNNKFILDRFAEAPWSERLKKPVMKNVVRVDREFDDPLPPEARNLDAVFMVLFYHDTVWMRTDRAKMDRAIFQALKPGGIFGVIDHSAKRARGFRRSRRCTGSKSPHCAKRSRRRDFTSRRRATRCAIHRTRAIGTTRRSPQASGGARATASCSPS